MNKEKITMNDIVAVVRKRTGMKKEDIQRCFHSILGVISKNVDDGNIIVLPDFGSFSRKHVNGRRYIMPDKRTVMTNKHTVVRFHPYKNFTSYHIKN